MMSACFVSYSPCVRGGPCRIRSNVSRILARASVAPNDDVSKLDRTLRSIQASRIVLCVRFDDASVAYHAARASLSGGIRTIEVTMTTPRASRIIAKLREEFPTSNIGAGTVVSAAQAREAIAAGALFAMSPVLNVDVVKACHHDEVLAIPGAATPTECYAAYAKAEAKLVKVFPASLYGGVEFVRAMQRTMPDIPLLPCSSGVRLERVHDYLSCGNVYAIGVSKQILEEEFVKQRDWQAVTDTARRWAALSAMKMDSVHSAGA